jgi:serine/threonine-protein kinase
VGDFGIATVASEASVTHTGQVLGTAAYISPEQAVGESATSASDRYALAVVAWEILTGHRPFQGETPAAQARAHVELPVPPASTTAAGLPPAVDEVLERGLSKDPAWRPATARALVDELEAALGDESEPIATPTRRFLHTGRDALAGVGAAGDAAAPEPTRATDAPLVPQAPRTPPPASPPPASGRDDDGRRRGPAWALIAAMAVALVAAAALAVAISGGGGSGGGSNASSTTEQPTKKQGRKGNRAAARDRGTATAPSTTPTQETQTQQTQPQPLPASVSPVALNNQAYALMQLGDNAGAVPLLQRSVTAFRDQRRTGEVTYAYALYNLGRSLRLSGRPGEAIPYLEERLQISDDRDAIVQRELDAARAAAGGSTGAGPGPRGKGHAKHEGRGAAYSAITD